MKKPSSESYDNSHFSSLVGDIFPREGGFEVAWSGDRRFSDESLMQHDVIRMYSHKEPVIGDEVFLVPPEINMSLEELVSQIGTCALEEE